MLKLLKKQAFCYNSMIKQINKKCNDGMSYTTKIHTFKQKLDIIVHNEKNSVLT